MPLQKRILFLFFILAASFILLNSVVFLIHSVYRPPSWKLICGNAYSSTEPCVEPQTLSMADVNSIYRLNVQGSFYLIAIITLLLGPFMGRKDIFPPLLYSFGGFAAVFAYLATRGQWFFEVGSDTPESLVSVLLFLICLGVSFLLYKRAEVVIDSCGLTCDVIGRESLVKNSTKIKVN